MWGLSVTVVETKTVAGSTCRYSTAPTARARADVMVVVELAASVPPIWVPAPPEHFLATQGTVHRNTLKVGAPIRGLEMVTMNDSATRATFPVLVTLDVWKVFEVKVIEVTEAVAPQFAEVTASVP